MIPAPRLAKPAKTQTFETLLISAMGSGLRDARGYALDFGVDETALIRYADGAVCDGEERRTIEHVVSRNRWSRDFVVNHVKRKRHNERSRNAA